MSASLVGSEMCIRDRPDTAPPDTAYGHSSRTPPRHQRDAGHNRTQRTPVSYTHLTLPTICSV
eukprot:14048904-Alexandrium_andersonii.AAC.1